MSRAIMIHAHLKIKPFVPVVTQYEEMKIT
jgi:hypothetical protein